MAYQNLYVLDISLSLVQVIFDFCMSLISKQMIRARHILEGHVKRENNGYLDAIIFICNQVVQGVH